MSVEMTPADALALALRSRDRDMVVSLVMPLDKSALRGLVVTMSLLLRMAYEDPEAYRAGVRAKLPHLDL